MKKRIIKYGGAIIGREELKALNKSIKKSVKTRNWQASEQVQKFEKEFAEYLGVKHAIMTTSGSCAGLLALSALEFPKGSEIIIPATTFPTIFNIILQNNLIPVVVDSKIGSYSLDIGEVERAINPFTKAIIAINVLGNPINFESLREVANRNNVKLIVDNCDGSGSSYKGKKVETYADISFTSTHGAHIISSAGVGGMVFTDDAELAKNVRILKDWGRQFDTNKTNTYETLPSDYNPRFIYEKIGYNFQPLELQGAIGRVQLKKIEKIKKARNKNCACVVNKLRKYGSLVIPTTIDGADPCWFSIPLTYKGDRGPLIKHLEANGIETRSMFSGNIIKHPAYKNSEYKIGPDGLKEADYILEHSFWVSCHNSLTKKDLDYIIKTFDDYFQN